jgi:hypothetical protein
MIHHPPKSAPVLKWSPYLSCLVLPIALLSLSLPDDTITTPLTIPTYDARARPDYFLHQRTGEHHESGDVTQGPALGILWSG